MERKKIYTLTEKAAARLKQLEGNATPFDVAVRLDDREGERVSVGTSKLLGSYLRDVLEDVADSTNVAVVFYAKDSDSMLDFVAANADTSVATTPPPRATNTQQHYGGLGEIETMRLDAVRNQYENDKRISELVHSTEKKELNREIETLKKQLAQAEKERTEAVEDKKQLEGKISAKDLAEVGKNIFLDISPILGLASSDPVVQETYRNLKANATQLGGTGTPTPPQDARTRAMQDIVTAIKSLPQGEFEAVTHILTVMMEYPKLIPSIAHVIGEWLKKQQTGNEQQATE